MVPIDGDFLRAEVLQAANSSKAFSPEWVATGM
jgi:hypothetical protein